MIPEHNFKTSTQRLAKTFSRIHEYPLMKQVRSIGDQFAGMKKKIELEKRMQPKIPEWTRLVEKAEHRGRIQQKLLDASKHPAFDRCPNPQLFEGILAKTKGFSGVQDLSERLKEKTPSQAIQRMNKSLREATFNIPAFHLPHFNIDEFCRLHKEEVKLLMRNEWYFDPHMYLDELYQCQELLKEGRIEEVDEIMVKHFESRLNDLENYLTEMVGPPQSKQVIKDAFWAHKQKRYALSIRALLSEVDGIFHRNTGCYFFMKRYYNVDRDQKTEEIADLCEDGFVKARLQALTIELPIRLSEGDRREKEKNPDLNRHQVIHGESFSDTQKNSLKVIALLNFLAHLFNDEDFVVPEN